MPVHVDIRVNDDTPIRLHIGRVDPLRPDRTEYEYLVVEAYEPDRMVPWGEGVRFEHTYDDGLLVCVQKALEALNG